MMSSSFGPKIHLRGALLHTLTYGGLGHRPLLSEELVLVGFLWSYFATPSTSWEITHIWPSFAILANLSDHVPSTLFGNLT